MSVSAPSNLPPVRYSNRAATRFFHIVDLIGKAHEPTATQLAELDRSYNSTGDFLSKCPEFQGDLIQIHAHGSRALGTLVRPRSGSGEGFDIDLIARLRPEAYGRYQGENGPYLLLERLHNALTRYADAHRLTLRRWERCATLEYAEGMRADIAPVIDSPLLSGAFGESHALIPDRALRLFDSTNPRGYAKHFNCAAAVSPNFMTKALFSNALDTVTRADVTPLPDAQEVFDRLLCRLVQLLKLHRNFSFGEYKGAQDLAPSSVFLTTLAAMAYEIQAPKPHQSPLDLLLDIVKSMPEHFQRISHYGGAEEWILPNPSAPRDNLAGSMNTPARQKAFLAWHTRLIGDLMQVLDAIEYNQGMDVLAKTLTNAFGPRSAGAFQQNELERRNSSRAAGKVTMLASASGGSISVPSRPHTYFGQ